MAELRTVFLVDFQNPQGIPSELEEILQQNAWNTLRPGLAYVLEWQKAINPREGGLWPRIEAVVRAARELGVDHALLTVARGEKIPLPTR